MFALALLVASRFDDPAQKIIDRSITDNQVMKHLRELCFDIGARPTGSPECTKAEEWALAKFKSFGYGNAHMEKWGDVPVGFQRGPNNVARQLSPSVNQIKFTTYCWEPGTDGLKKGKVLMMPRTMEQFTKAKDSLRGTWVLGGAPAPKGEAVSKEDAALVKKGLVESGALGFIYGAEGDLLQTHGTWANKTFEKHSTIVNVIVRRVDWDMLAHNVQGGKETVAEFNVDNHFLKGPVPVHNIVAELKGTEHPDEVVILGGHLDSWNTPGSQGANDNGTGSCSTLEAARLLINSGLRPKRTIRFILFTGEEQGLLGSGAYVKDHEAELPKISACIIDDGGTNYESGSTGYASWEPYFKPAYELMTKAFPNMPMKFYVDERHDGSFGSDNASFWGKKIPSVFMRKAGSQDYNHIWHTQYDRYEEVVPEYLKQVSTSMAVLSFTVANADSLVPRK